MDGTFKMSVALFLKGINWYIYALSLLYIVFYTVYKYIHEDNHKLIVLWAVVILLTLIVLYVSKNYIVIDRSYFISEWAFPFGVTIYTKRDKIDYLINNHFGKSTFLMFVCLVVFFLGASIANEYTIADLVTHNVMLFPFYYFVMILCKYCKFGNPLLKYLNSISFEIYLYQFIVLMIVKKNIDSIDIMYFAWVTIITILLVCLVSLTRKLIMKVLCKNK